MPPKPKITKEQIAAAALEMIKTEGLSSLSARELGKRLGTSSSPIFTFYQNMDEVKRAARKLAMDEFMEYISDYREYTPAFKRIGMMFVSYGMYAPELFKLLFMQEHKGAQGFGNILDDLGEFKNICVELICRDYEISNEDAQLLFEQCWTHAYGLGTLCAMRVCSLSEDEISMRLGANFASHMMLIKSGKMNYVFDDVQQRTDGIFHGISVKEMPFTN